MASNPSESPPRSTAAQAGPGRLEPGTVVANRYTIVQVLDEVDSIIRYRARDIQRCPDPACGFADNPADVAFCLNCGRELAEHGLVTLQAESTAQPADEASSVHLDRFIWEEVNYVVVPDAAPCVTAAPFSSGVRLQVGFRTDKGAQQQSNQDSLFVLTTATNSQNTTGPVSGLYIVADGIGGSEAGEVASQSAIRAIAEYLTGRVIAPLAGGSHFQEAELRSLVGGAIQAANAQVHELATDRQNDMGTTLTLALLLDASALVANVGDSRAYLWHEGRLQLLTRDHSVVARLVEEGKLRPEEIYTHPERNLIYRSLGVQGEESSDLFPAEGGTLALSPGARLVLCSDGLWEMLRDADIDQVLWEEPDPQRACDALVRLANLAGGLDNISVIVVSVLDQAFQS